MIVLDPVLAVISVALNLYWFVVIISVVLSWLVQFNVVNTSNQFVSMIGEFTWRATEPALRPIRRFVPNLGGIDISPVVLLLAIFFLQQVITNIRVSLRVGAF
ncbi:YggT family protein [Denitrobaculum tricleocarpae]|uniref:YggT family protein n=1 Tax=Denitrobaculum tricleocarpae TaxID=2591009 RepID=A0A545TRB8_9PROT|nr:YggT family protein [Denitrobaculum tricleocarpae]TQV79671.1 YggT family protein [Denitrobaculum tricleocarpae]